MSRHRIGLGDGALYSTLLDALEVPSERHAELLERLSARDLAGLELRVDRLGLPKDARDLLVSLPEIRGGPEVLDRAGGPALRRWTACARYTPRSWTGAWPTA